MSRYLRRSIEGEQIGRKTVKPADKRSQSILGLTWLPSSGRSGDRGRGADLAQVRHRECRSGVPDLDRDRRGAYGLWPSLAATVLASLSYNFFFMEPLYTFTIDDPRNVAAFVFFTLISLLVSNVAARVRTQAVAAASRARTTESPYAFSRKLAGVGTLDDLLWATAYQIALMLKVRVVLLLDENGSIEVKAGYPPEDVLDDADIAAAKWAWQNDRIAGRGRTPCPAPTPLRRCHRPRRDRRRRHRQRAGRADADERVADALSPGRARGRARCRLEDMTAPRWSRPAITPALTSISHD